MKSRLGEILGLQLRKSSIQCFLRDELGFKTGRCPKNINTGEALASWTSSCDSDSDLDLEGGRGRLSNARAR